MALNRNEFYGLVQNGKLLIDTLYCDEGPTLTPLLYKDKKIAISNLKYYETAEVLKVKVELV